MSKNFERTGKPFARVNTIIRTVCLAVQTVSKNFERTGKLFERMNIIIVRFAFHGHIYTIFRPPRWCTTWRLHTGLCKFAQDISMNIRSLGGQTDLCSLPIFYSVTSSWSYLLNIFGFIFSLCYGETFNNVSSYSTSDTPGDFTRWS